MLHLKPLPSLLARGSLKGIWNVCDRFISSLPVNYNRPLACLIAMRLLINTENRFPLLETNYHPPLASSHPQILCFPTPSHSHQGRILPWPPPGLNPVLQCSCALSCSWRPPVVKGCAAHTCPQSLQEGGREGGHARLHMNVFVTFTRNITLCAIIPLIIQGCRQIHWLAR